MIKALLKVFGSFARRMQDDHMGAYAATCAYFIMISFVPFIMIILSVASILSADTSALAEGLLTLVPAGLSEYVRTIITEVMLKSHAYLPVSLLILVWSASKVFHALSNGLNVISKVGETRGWFFLRFRSMVYVIVFLLMILLSLTLSISGPALWDSLFKRFPDLSDIMLFLFSIRSLFGYFGLIALFLFIYKFLPNCYYTFRSQFPGALLVSTIWMFFSYLISLYYQHNRNFSNIYGSLTGIILAMIWMYFCCYFLYLGAELNRVIYEDPEDNMIVNVFDAMKDVSLRNEQIIAEELDEHSVWKPFPVEEEEEIPSEQPKDINIPWADEGVTRIPERRAADDSRFDFYHSLRKKNHQDNAAGESDSPDSEYK